MPLAREAEQFNRHPHEWKLAPRFDEAWQVTGVRGMADFHLIRWPGLLQSAPMERLPDRTYALEIGGRPVLAFAANGVVEARSLVKEEWLQDDLRAATSNGAPIWDGATRLSVRAASLQEAARYAEQAKSAPASDELLLVYLIERE